ncbi:MAG: ribbon-helix-helix domain-containing protein [Roseibium sp.]|nr:ribbon-helix-helix domain-containing protein [Roseibium sp.]
MPLVKRSFTLQGHRTSLALEPEFWRVIDGEAKRRAQSVASLISQIDRARDPDDTLSSTMRIWVVRTLLDNRSTDIAMNSPDNSQ